MPTYTAIAFQYLLEPPVPKSYGKHQINERNEEEKVEEDIEPPPAPANHIFISPALYITPDPAPIPETSSGSLSPSPYVVNHKRRGGGEAFAKRKLDGLEEVEQVSEKTDLDLDLKLEEELADENLFDEDEGFLDPKCKAASIGSVNEVKVLDCRSYVSAQGEFFDVDADEDFSVEGSSLNGSTCGTNIELELHATRFKLLEEIERRKTAEDALNMMRCQWQNISTVLSKAGLTLPSPSDVISDMQLDNATIEQLYQEVVVSRFVAEAIGKGQARAEAELSAESILESKNHEISRLRDRLRYYAAVNHEMSQRNQEIIEVARKQRQRKRTQKKWLWSCIGLSVAIGVSVVAYKHLPQASKHQPISYSNESTGAGTHKTA